MSHDEIGESVSRKGKVSAVVPKNEETNEHLTVKNPQRNQEKNLVGFCFQVQADKEQHKQPQESEPASERGDFKAFFRYGLADVGQSFHGTILS